MKTIWHNKNFLLLWSGETVSGFGSAVTRLAMPLTAVLILEATPGQMGYLGVARTLPVLLFSLIVGVWVDRSSRRPILVRVQVGKALLIATIPLAALMDFLSFEHLYVVAFLMGSLSLIFDSAIIPLLPSVVPREDLVEGNSKLHLSRSVASSAGPGLAGVLVQLVTAPLALLLDVFSFLISALCLNHVQLVEAVRSSKSRDPFWKEIGEGLRFIRQSPILLSITLPACVSSYALSVQGTVFLIYLTRELGLGPGQIGIIFSSAGAAAAVGALVSATIESRLGPGRTIIAGALIGSIGLWIIPFVQGSIPMIIGCLIVAEILFGFGLTVYTVNQVSLRQAITPNRMLDRVSASRRFLIMGMGPIGALTGGALGSQIGLRPTLTFAAFCVSIMIIWLILSPLRTLREQPSEIQSDSRNLQTESEFPEPS